MTEAELLAEISAKLTTQEDLLTALLLCGQWLFTVLCALLVLHFAVAFVRR